MTIPPLPLDTRASGATRTARRRTVIGLLVLLVLLVSAAAWFKLDQSANAQATRPPQKTLLSTDTMARAPKDVRVRVRVINATRTRGLAKRAANFLRDRGFDVVDFDSDPKSTRQTTLVLTHTGHREWSERIQRALGVGSLDISSDTSRYIDVTVLLGDDWHAPSQPFRP